MLKIGLTGGIGSGKTTIANVFSALGIPVFFADDEAKKVLITNRVKKKLYNKWGNNVFFDNGDIDKASLAEIVFSNSNELKYLNSIIHPEMLLNFEKWVAEKKAQNFNYVILEAAILFDAGFHKYVDKTICVSAPDEERIKRVINRDDVTKEQVKSRINSQWLQGRIIDISDYEILNSEEDMVLEQILKLHNVFRS
ncbi:MAG: dephospho-CoA kinase [Bacteroidales bacterium]|nr:dephospho-CoA kinase [Bacteroidales bacterium]